MASLNVGKKFHGKLAPRSQGPTQRAVKVSDGLKKIFQVNEYVKFASGSSKYQDIICCLPVKLSKRIFGLLDEKSLICCRSVCKYWRLIAEETLEEIRLTEVLNSQIKDMMECWRRNRIPSPSFANFVEVPVPLNDDEQEAVPSTCQEVMPFQAVYDNIKTKTVKMEERNVYCGAYFIDVVLKQEDKNRVLDYSGGRLMAMSYNKKWVQLLRVASETKTIAVLKGHLSPIRAMLLCEDRNLLITAACDSNIRCWNIRTGRCDMVLCGHSGTINCLDVHADSLASGSKDCTVKVWSLHTGQRLQGLRFRHRASVQCVKINRATIYSSCNQGVVKIWNMENGSLLKVIKAHRSSVKCLFLDEWHLLSGDSKGNVMAWSVNCGASGCLMTFSHPEAVKSLTLTYLRVITGCSDGKIRIFNFLNGDCLTYITLRPESGPLLSLHFQENSILVNTASSVQLYQFFKVVWDYTNREQANVVTQGGSLSETSADMGRKMSHTCPARGDMAPPSQRTLNSNSVKPKSTSFLQESRFHVNQRACGENRKQPVIQSEKAACGRMKKRSADHPPTRDALFLRLAAIQRARCVDEVSINTEYNARLGDLWRTEHNL